MIVDENYAKNSSWKPDLFKGKVAFITGGSGTICKVQAKALVALGANAAIIGRNPDKAEAAAKEIASLRPGATVLGIGNVDVRSVQSIKHAADLAVSKLGKIDFVIAGAAGNFLADFNHLSSNAFKSVISIDLLGAFNTVKAVFPHLKKSQGCLLFVSATLQYTGIPLQTHASAAKAGIDAMSNNLAVEFGPLGIRVNCIAPGAIGGNGGDSNDSSMTEGMKRLGGAKIEQLPKEIPLQRLGTTTDIADATVWLFSPAASYVTGEIVVVDGGMWHSGLRTNNSPTPEQLVKLLNDKPRL
ncbi:2,4-dienoyl-CoA reductase (NADPH) [Saccharomycopsis crataegensis]|uniref:2,4-dienoyl-CoA reductase [(3E)-enoyl-CoA-producing] n=1 Tax=Saccharomycopsis crataegensis TaxID=43959 RepID=A0AAV5QV94_9ASCO|nr:2,4-dienoyl-CoA reductase (NADPH) [Saccharomycopsis crataegensis]